MDSANINLNLQGTLLVKEVTGLKSVTFSDVNIGRFTTGKTVLGEILSVEEGTAKIKINDELMLEAKLGKDIMLEPGKTVPFLVKNNGKQLTLSALFTNTSNENIAKNVLSTAGIPATPENLFAASKMMEHGLPVDRENAQIFFNELKSNSYSDLFDIITLHETGMEVNEENLISVNLFNNNKSFILDFAQNLQQAISNDISSFMNNNQISEIKDYLQNVIDVMNQIEAEIDTVESNTSGEIKPDLVNNNIETLPLEFETFVNHENDDKSNVIKSNVNDFQKAQTTDTLNEKNELIKNDFKASSNEIDGKTTETVLGKEPAVNESNEKNSYPINIDNQIEDKPDIKTDFGNVSVKNDGAYKPEIKDGTNTHVLTEAESDNTEYQAKTAAEAPKPERTLSLIKNEIDFETSSKNINKEIIDKLVKEFADNVSKYVKKTISVTPEDFADKKKMVEFQTKLKQVFDKAMNITKADNSAFSETVKQAANSNKFVYDLNKVFEFIQVPLNINNNFSNAELYVYRHKSKEVKPGEEITAFLSLSTENIGNVNVYIKLRDGRVNTDFRVENEEILDLLEKNINILNSHLEEKGYSLNVSAGIKSDNDYSDFQEKLTGNKQTKMISKMSFDARA